ncbi:MAG TPA: PAS domain S-box protein, partial [Cytophagaceae bacterium]|nr:PAS domain S-box protein [Cytophagaceae bacterium]
MNQEAALKKLQEENKKLREDIVHQNTGEQRYKRLFDASPDIIIEVDKDFSIIICHMPGIPQASLSKVAGRNIFDVTPEVFHEKMRTALGKVLSTGEKADYESQGETLGAYRYYNNHLSPIYDEKGEIHSIYFISRDVTQQKVADQIIIESEKKLKALFDSSQHLHILIGPDANCLWFNKKASITAEIFFNKELNVGTFDYDYIPEPFLSSFRQAFKKCLSGEIIIYEREYPKIEGGTSNVEFTLQPVYNSDNTILGISMIGIDITERTLSEENLKKINKELVQQNTQLNQYSYIISHNLRGPIVTLLGLTDVFERFNTDLDLQTKVVGHIKKSALHL